MVQNTLIKIQLNLWNLKVLILFILLLGNPQLNGRAERLNQTLNNCATTLLIFAKLPLNFWDSAIFMRCLFV